MRRKQLDVPGLLGRYLLHARRTSAVVPFESPSAMPADSQARNAGFAGTVCFAIWGLVPLVFQVIGRAGPGPWEILTHRVLWGLLAAALMVGFARQWGQLLQVLRAPRTMGWLTQTTQQNTKNWVL